MKTIFIFILAMLFATLSACGGGDGAIQTSASSISQEAQRCKDHLITMSVVSKDALETAGYSLKDTPQGVEVTFHNKRLSTDSLYHVFGVCRVETYAVILLGS